MLSKVKGNSKSVGVGLRELARRDSGNTSSASTFTVKSIYFAINFIVFLIES